MVFKADYCLMEVKSIAECSQSILQHFRPSLSKLSVGIKTIVLSIFEWPFYTGFTVLHQNPMRCLERRRSVHVGDHIDLCSNRNIFVTNGLLNKMRMFKYNKAAIKSCLFKCSSKLNIQIWILSLIKEIC